MMGAIFRETLKTKWKHILYWGGGMGLMGFYATIVVPDVDMLKQYGDLIESMPSFMINMVGGGETTFLSSPEGFLSVEFFGWALLVFSVYAITAGLNVAASEEDDGVLDTLMSWPIPRWQLIAEKLLAYTVIIVGMLTLSLIGIYAGVSQTEVFQIGFMKLLANVFNLLPGTLLMLVITTAVASIVRRKGVATGIVTVVLVASYFIDSLGRSASTTFLHDLRVASYYKYYANSEVMQNGLIVSNLLVLFVAVVVFTVITFYTFQRRDIGL